MTDPTLDHQGLIEQAREGRTPLGRAVAVLLPHFVAKGGRAGVAQWTACAHWIMLDAANSHSSDPLKEARERLLNAWLAEQRDRSDGPQVQPGRPRARATEEPAVPPVALSSAKHRVRDSIVVEQQL